MNNTEKYNIYIWSIEWKNKRELAFEFRWRSCQKCSSKTFLQIHYWTYHNLYKEKMSDLFVLCSKCHFDLHEKYWTKDLLRATKFFIKWKEYIPRKKKKKLPLEERKKRREERKLMQIPMALEALKKWLKFKESWVSSIKNWRKAIKIIKLWE